MASLNDLMHRFYDKFFKSGDRLPVDVGGQITVQEVNLGEVKQGARGENAEPWQVTLSGKTATPFERIISETTEIPASSNAAVHVNISGYSYVAIGIRNMQNNQSVRLAVLPTMLNASPTSFDGANNIFAVGPPIEVVNAHTSGNQAIATYLVTGIHPAPYLRVLVYNNSTTVSARVRVYVIKGV